MSQYPSFCHTFSIYLLHIYPSVDFLSKYCTTSPEENFFIDIEKPFTFFMLKKGTKSNHSNLLSCDYWPFSWLNFYQFFVHMEVVNEIVGFPKYIILNSLILYIRNSDYITLHLHNILLQFYHISCFTGFYGHISLACY